MDLTSKHETDFRFKFGPIFPNRQSKLLLCRLSVTSEDKPGGVLGPGSCQESPINQIAAYGDFLASFAFIPVCDEFPNGFPLPTVINHVHSAPVIKRQMNRLIGVTPELLPRRAHHVFTLLNHPGNSTVLELTVCMQPLPPFEAKPRCPKTTARCTQSHTAMNPRLPSSCVNSGPCFHIWLRAKLSALFFSLHWQFRHITFTLGSAPTPAQKESLPTCWVTALLSFIFKFLSTFFHLLVFVLVFKSLSIVSPGGLALYLCFLCRLCLYPSIADVVRPASCPFRQRWILINAAHGGGNASGLYVSPSYPFFSFFPFLTWTGTPEILLLLYLLIMFEWIAEERQWFSAVSAYGCVTFQGWICLYCHLVCRWGWTFSSFKEKYKRLFSGTAAQQGHCCR